MSRRRPRNGPSAGPAPGCAVTPGAGHGGRPVHVQPPAHPELPAPRRLFGPYGGLGEVGDVSLGQPVELLARGLRGRPRTVPPALTPRVEPGPYERGGRAVEGGQPLGGLAQRPVALQGEVAAGAGDPGLLLLRRVGRDRGRGGVRLRVGQVLRGQGEDRVARLREPAVLHQDGDPQSVLVDQPVDGARGEPGDRAGRERRDLVPGGGQGLHRAPAARDDVPLRTGQVHMGRSAAQAVGGRPVVHAQVRNGDSAGQTAVRAHHGCVSRYLTISSRSQAPSATTTR